MPLRLLPIVLFVLPWSSGRGADEVENRRPNILWIMSEDNSKHYLRHFDPSGAAAPHIEALAQHGITFDRAFSCARSARSPALL